MDVTFHAFLLKEYQMLGMYGRSGIALAGLCFAPAFIIPRSSPAAEAKLLQSLDAKVFWVLRGRWMRRERQPLRPASLPWRCSSLPMPTTVLVFGGAKPLVLKV